MARRPFSFDTNKKGCLLCNSHCKTRDGHVQIKVNRKVVAAHRYIYEQCFGLIPNGKVVRHTCDNPSCLNPEHLLLGEHEDNVRDRVERNRSAAGVGNGRSKLTTAIVLEIRKSKLSNQQLSVRYGVDKKVIYNIKNYRAWKGVG